MKITKSPMSRIVVAQVVAAMVAAGLCLRIDPVWAVSSLFAGIVCIVPSLYVWLVSERPVSEGATGIDLVIRSEVGKYALLMSLMALVFVFYKPLNVLAFFGTLVVLQISAVVVPVIEAQRLLKRH